MMSLSKYTSTRQTTNTARMARLILGPCTDVLRDILRKEISPTNLSKKVKQWTDNLNNNKLRIPLFQSQIDTIFPSPTYQYGGNYSDLDISTLCIILRNVSKIPPHLKGWGEIPDPADRSVAANIERIRLLRNKYYGHIADIALSDSNFNEEWRNILDIVVELEGHLGTSIVYQESVKEIKTCSMDPELQHKYINMLGAVDELYSAVSKVSETLDDVKKKLSLCMDPRLEKEIETTMDMVKNHYKEMDKIFVKTRAFDRAKELLEKNRHVVIKGVPGAGKTTLAKWLLKTAMDGGKRPLLVLKMSKLYGRISPFDNLAIFIDNAFGEFSFSKKDFNKFLNMKNVIESLVKPSNSGMGNILILTVRHDIYMEIVAKQKSAASLFSSVTDLSSGEYALESEELVMFLNNYNLPGNIKEDLKLRQTELYLPLGFPQCCRLARENPAFGNDLSNFLRSPSIFLKEYLETLVAERAVKTAVLIYILLKGGSVDSSLFSVQKDWKMKSIALKMLELSPPLLGEFHDSVKVFEGFLTIYDKINDSYSFSHSSVQDILFHILIVTLPEETILNCHPVLFQRLTTGEHQKCTNVLIDAELFAIVSSRIIQILRDGSPGEFESISLLDLWNDKAFYEYVLADQVRSDNFKECVDSDGNALLVHFGKSGHIGWVKYLFQNNCDETQKYRCLNAACRENHVNIVHPILSMGVRCDLNTCFNVVQSGNLELLLKICKTVDLNQTCFSLVRTNTNHSLIQEICSSRQIHLVQPLLERYPMLIDNKSTDGDNVLHYATQIGEFNLSSYLVDNYSQLIDVKNNDGFTALHFACASGDEKLISFLIEKGFNIDAMTNDGESVLHIACLCGKFDACNFLVTNYLQLIDVKDNDGYTVLHSACLNGDRQLISFLIKKGLDINALTNDGDSALHIACRNDKYDACKFLVTNHPPLINVKNNKGYTVLHSACENGDGQLISFLLENGMDIHSLTNDGESVLHIACLCGKYDACSYLVSNYPHLIDVKNNKGYTVLHTACVNGDRQLISFLLENGLEIGALTNIGENVLHITCRNGKYDTSEFLVTNYPQLIDVKDNDGNTVLHSVCVNGDRQLISFLIKKGLDINALTNDGDSALHIACCNGKYDASEFLVTNYPQLIDVKDNDGNTVLHSACVNGDGQLISFLIKKGLDINALTNDGDSALHIACCNDNYGACEFLVTNHPRLINVKNNKGYTVLHSACENGDGQLISFLLENGLDINAQTNDGESVLYIACLCGKYDACSYLVSNYPHLIDVKNNKGYTVLHTACVNGDRQLISFLLENGLEIGALTNIGENVLHITCRNGKYDTSEFLVTNYPQLIDVKDNDGNTVLHSACVNGDGQLISFLIKKGLDINALTNDGDSALHIACCNDNYGACEFLVTNHPQLINVKNNKGYTVLHSACESGDRKLISFLIEKGLDINAQTNDGKSVLHIACFNGDIDLCKLIVHNNPQLLQSKDYSSVTVLHAAARSGNLELFKYFVSEGLNVDCMTNDGRSVVDFTESSNICLNEYLETHYPLLFRRKKRQQNQGFDKTKRLKL
ncbi:ankyrin-1-like [Saccostrea echinata]|uniref:ankyrin-1-like n=1 Tax=Saccostrea echinata TaxID=191078 RepID=UPI002A7F3026|nr:ankyrin-1-like [Saccostrea echinata]